METVAVVVGTAVAEEAAEATAVETALAAADVLNFFEAPEGDLAESKGVQGGNSKIATLAPIVSI